MRRDVTGPAVSSWGAPRSARCRSCNASSFDDDAPMRRSHHRAALTEVIADATARFQADLRRLARSVLRDEVARILATNEPMATPTVTGTRARHPGLVARPRRSPVAGPRKPAAAAEARRTTAVATSKPPAAARTSKPPAAARASKPAATAGKYLPKFRTTARTERPAAARVPAVAGAPEGPAVALSKPERELVAVAAQVELKTAGPRAGLTPVAIASDRSCSRFYASTWERHPP